MCNVSEVIEHMTRATEAQKAKWEWEAKSLGR